MTAAIQTRRADLLSPVQNHAARPAATTALMHMVCT
eukprot:CAMPEP_0202879072 /NCGR_PEP_ID=MMETSP1391-20130828/33118_1 /ASSEMBLY_ACC=CAM_ASM_000867 /TAXON_ID=1034604 /ORGANISM="Chlamydomonas leiostraca, Strain SAG 11-49" /LENGTH=35 /DNA_ID= /DNA_START= /DNA_END= /DNA_ORIENTATION=